MRNPWLNSWYTFELKDGQKLLLDGIHQIKKATELYPDSGYGSRWTAQIKIVTKHWMLIVSDLRIRV